MVIIRQAAIEDAPGLGAMHVQSWREAYAGLLPQELLDALKVEDRVAGWTKALKEAPERRRSWVAVEGARIVGFVTAGPSRDKDADSGVVGEILGIYLLKEFNGTGIGRAMMQTGLEHLAEAKHREVTLWVLRDNARAIRFYEAAGFQPDGATKDEERHGHVMHEARYRREVALPGRALIRLATAADAPTLGVVHVHAWHDAYTGILPQAMLDKLSADEQAQRHLRILADKSAREWIAEDSMGALGFLSAGPTRDKDDDPSAVGEVRAIYLVKRAWDMGLGRRLLRQGLFFLSNLRMQSVIVWVMRDNARARRFYELAGFSFDGTSQEIMVKGHPAIDLRYRASLKTLFDRSKA